MRPEAGPWWRQAQADLATGQQTLALGIYYAASWFAQQSVEKALKALFLEQHGSLPPRTHDLEYLGRQLQVPSQVAGELALLNPAFDLVRYPSSTAGSAPVDVVTVALANEHLGIAERVLAWIDPHFNPPSIQP